jgi:CBS-domain-containing membrane protein
MEIQQIMSQPAITCRSTDTLDTAAHKMWDHDCGAIPVVDDDGRLVGMITDRDICMAAFTQGSPLHCIPVANAMASAVVACQADDSIESAEELMSERQIRRLPVIDGAGHPVGVLSLNDIARHAASARRRNGGDREVVDTLAAICQPRRLALQVATAFEMSAAPPSVM